MIKKKIYILAVMLTLIIIGCEKDPVTPRDATSNNISRESSNISGETELIESISDGTINYVDGGKKVVRNEVRAYQDNSNNGIMSGLRKIVTNKNFNSNNEGKCFGTFSIDTEEGYWEGQWTGITTSEGTTIKANGYNFENRDQSCEWTYFLPSSLEGKSGTFTAKIYSARD